MALHDLKTQNTGPAILTNNIKVGKPKMQLMEEGFSPVNEED